VKINPGHPSPQLALAIDRFNTFMTQDLFGGSKSIKMAWVINLHKILTPFVIFGLMIIFSNNSKEAWIYLSLHSSYCLCWLMKHNAFRDKKWEVKITAGGAIFTFILLATYWTAPFMLISRPQLLSVSNGYLFLCISLHTIGTMIMMTADCQKYFTMKYRQGLITEGIYRYSRHPNYLGEMMIYASYALLAQHWLPWVILAYWWSTVFLVNMLIVEGSISRHPGWDAYRERTGFLLPKIFSQRMFKRSQIQEL